MDQRLSEWNHGSVSSKGWSGSLWFSCLGRRSTGDDGRWWAPRGRWRRCIALTQRHRWPVAGLQVVATWRRLAEVLRVGSTKNEADGWWCSPANRGGGREWRVERAGRRKCGGGGAGRTLARRAAFIAARGGGIWRCGNGNCGREMTAALRFRRRTCGLGVVVRTEWLTRRPHWFDIYPDFSKPVQTCKFKIYASTIPKIPKFSMRLDWCILHNHINCADIWILE
jgi:hypothetical protein